MKLRIVTSLLYSTQTYIDLNERIETYVKLTTVAILNTWWLDYKRLHSIYGDHFTPKFEEIVKICFILK